MGFVGLDTHTGRLDQKFLTRKSTAVKALHACTVVVVHGKYPGGPVTKAHVITGRFWDNIKD